MLREMAWEGKRHAPIAVARRFILSRYPIEHSEAIVLPGEKESRSLLEAYIRTEQGTVRVVTTHLGVGCQFR